MTPFAVVRARYWLRRGKPLDYLWDRPNLDPRTSHV